MDNPTLVTFKEAAEIVELAKAKAKAEGTTFSAIIRRGLRREVFSSPSLPTSEQCPKTDERVAA